MSGDGALLFARYAYPPNALGYCGPADHGALLEYGSGRLAEQGLVELARGFEGAWPYLELIAGANGLADPLDRRVVEAYWIGNELLDRVSTATIGNHVEERFRKIAARAWDALAETIDAGAVPHHNFHVFCVYPWVGLMRAGPAEPALRVLDRCRIRLGRILALDGDHVSVAYRALVWDGREISLGPTVIERATRALDGRGFVNDARAGDWVSLHWGWICDTLSGRAARALDTYTRRHLAIVNRGGALTTVA